MQQSVTEYPTHTFAWIDLSTPDPDAAKRFYTELFGWEAVDTPLPQGGVYTMLKQDGKDVAALSQQQASEMEQGHPAYWSSYVSVENVDEMAKNAQNAGATLVAPPFDVMEEGRMAVIQDPTGAFVSLWQPMNHIGAQIVNVPNSLGWNELVTRDPDKAAAFYSELFGWEAQLDETNASPEPYVTFLNAGRMAGGMMAMNEAWEGVPPHWAVYFAVEDPHEIARQAASLGGTVITPAFEAEGVGTIAVLQDPHGATFNVIQLQNPDPMP